MMEKLEIKNARIRETMLGTEGHGIFTCYLHLDYGGSGQGFGGYSLDEPMKDESGKFLKRVGTAYGMDFIKCVLETLKVENWEDLTGTYLRVRGSHEKIYEIGHILEDRWFNPQNLKENK